MNYVKRISKKIALFIQKNIQLSIILNADKNGAVFRGKNIGAGAKIIVGGLLKAPKCTIIRVERNLRGILY